MNIKNTENLMTWESQIIFEKIRNGVLNGLTLIIIKERLTFHITYEISKSRRSPKNKLLTIITTLKRRLGL